MYCNTCVLNITYTESKSNPFLCYNSKIFSCLLLPSPQAIFYRQQTRGISPTSAKKESPYGLSFFAVYTPSFSSAASFRQVQNTAMACSSSATGGRDGAMRMLLSWGSLP